MSHRLIGVCVCIVAGGVAYVYGPGTATLTARR